MEIYKVYEYGLLYSASGYTEWTIHWSDGSVTTEMRPCVTVQCVPLIRNINE